MAEPPKKRDLKAEREARRAQALRENLRKRKAPPQPAKAPEPKKQD